METQSEHSLHELKMTLITFLGYGIFYGLSQIDSNATIPVTFYIPELSQMVTVDFPLESWLSIFIAGAAFAILLVKIFDQIYCAENSAVKQHLSKRALKILRDLFIFMVAAYCIFNAVHEVIKFVGYMLDTFPPSFMTNPGYANLYYYIYFYHEYFGHLFSIPLMVFFTIFMVGFLYEPASVKIAWYLWLFLLAIGIGFGATWVEGWAEGECQLINAIYDIGLLIGFGSYMKKKNIRLRDHPFFVVMLAEIIIYIIGVIIWGIYYGLLPYYPFFKEPPS